MNLIVYENLIEFKVNSNKNWEIDILSYKFNKYEDYKIFYY
jgi:hypothetical protein